MTPNPLYAVLVSYPAFAQDTVVQLVQDTVVVESPLPGGPAAVVRFLFQTVPQWLQMAGGIVGGIVGILVLVYVWRHRDRLIAWFVTRSQATKLWLVAAAVVLLVGGAAVGAMSWNYMQHDNGFCTGCHVMNPAFEHFTTSEHDSLSCHDCHQQSIFASMRQLHLWVLERPGEIGKHAPVSNEVCEACHVTGEPEVWQRVASTAGHRTHLESDSTALSDVMCVTCHGLEVHHFVPVDSTCAQADCHVDTEIVLGEMHAQTDLHCATCHEFTQEVPLLATRDSAVGTLRPAMDQCFSCHEMQTILGDFDPGLDPHVGTCGTCHNPHEQNVARDADATCATTECHATWRNRPFHVGSSHVDVGSQCTLCHDPHRAAVDPSDCVGCHGSLIERDDVPTQVRERLRRAMPFDTTRSLRMQGAMRWRHLRERQGDPGALGFRHWGMGASLPNGPPLLDLSLSQRLTVQPDTFAHSQHEELSCLTCHVAESGHGQLTFEAPRGCQICHHQDPTNSDCTVCHRSDEITAAHVVTVSVTTEGHPPRARSTDFDHDAHVSVDCVGCHTAPVTMTTPEATATCVDCHDDHHAASRECVTCHVGEEMLPPHTPPLDAHAGCDACHEPGTVTRLLPDRPFCVTCHVEEADHYPDRECTTCHLLSSPEAYRERLMVSGTER